MARSSLPSPFGDRHRAHGRPDHVVSPAFEATPAAAEENRYGLEKGILGPNEAACPLSAPLESSEAFLHAYEDERGARFSPYETEIAWAASIWEALHNARDELSYERLKAERVERLTRAHAG